MSVLEKNVPFSFSFISETSSSSSNQQNAPSFLLKIDHIPEIIIETNQMPIIMLKKTTKFFSKKFVGYGWTLVLHVKKEVYFLNVHLLYFCLCISSEDIECSYKGQTFKATESLVTKDCKRRCLCTVDGDQTSVMCSSLCPGYTVKCEAGEKAVYKEHRINGTQCSCKTPICKKQSTASEYQVMSLHKKHYHKNSNRRPVDYDLLFQTK